MATHHRAYAKDKDAECFDIAYTLNDLKNPGKTE